MDSRAAWRCRGRSRRAARRSGRRCRPARRGRCCGAGRSRRRARRRWRSARPAARACRGTASPSAPAAPLAAHRHAPPHGASALKSHFGETSTISPTTLTFATAPLAGDLRAICAIRSTDSAVVTPITQPLGDARRITASSRLWPPRATSARRRPGPTASSARAARGPRRARPRARRRRSSPAPRESSGRGGGSTSADAPTSARSIAASITAGSVPRAAAEAMPCPSSFLPAPSSRTCAVTAPPPAPRPRARPPDRRR